MTSTTRKICIFAIFCVIMVSSFTLGWQIALTGDDAISRREVEQMMGALDTIITQTGII